MEKLLLHAGMHNTIISVLPPATGIPHMQFLALFSAYEYV